MKYGAMFEGVYLISKSRWTVYRLRNYKIGG
jgi:hypothetical protein